MTISHRAIFLAAPIAALFLSGCATIFSGTKSEVYFTSVPSGATVVAGDQRGTTPVTLRLAKSTKRVTFIPPAHAPIVKASVTGAGDQAANERDVELDRDLGLGWLVLDVLFTPGLGLVGGIVDGSTSAWYTLPGIVHCDFRKPPGAPPKSEAWFSDHKQADWR